MLPSGTAPQTWKGALQEKQWLLFCMYLFHTHSVWAAQGISLREQGMKGQAGWGGRGWDRVGFAASFLPSLDLSSLIWKMGMRRG